MVLEPTGVHARVAPEGRLGSMDALRAFLVAWIIGGHALLGYTTVGGWAYSHFTEVRFLPQVEWVLAALIGTTGVFLMGTFFLISGMFTAVSLEHRTPGDFVLRRLVRLGVPYAVTVLLVWPAVEWFVTERTTGDSLRYVDLVTGRRMFDAGALWFVGVLLLFSLCWAAWSALVPRPVGGAVPRGRRLVEAAIAVGVLSFVLRLWLPAHGREWGHLKLWDWPELAAMFALGAVGGRAMATRIPDRLVRRCAQVALGTAAAVPVLALLAGVHNVAAAAPLYRGGWHWQAAAMALAEGILAVAGSVALIGYAQRHVDGTGPRAVAAARASYAAFVLQNVVLMALALAVRPLALGAEVKAPLVAALGIVLCFWLGHLLVTRSALRRVL